MLAPFVFERIVNLDFQRFFSFTIVALILTVTPTLILNSQICNCALNSFHTQVKQSKAIDSDYGGSPSQEVTNGSAEAPISPPKEEGFVIVHPRIGELSSGPPPGSGGGGAEGWFSFELFP